MSKHKPNRPDKWYSGEYKVQNTDKYIGDMSDIVYRSKWEYNFCNYCDNEDKIKKWSCEHITIPYNVIHNERFVTKTYIPDFWILIEENGEEKQYVIEVKPHKDTEYPIEPKKKSIKSLQNYEWSLKNYAKNLSKWEAAENYCKKRSMEFFLLTEKYFENKQIKLF